MVSYMYGSQNKSKSHPVNPVQPLVLSQTVSLVMVSYTYRIQNKTNHTQATQSDWTGSKTKTTCVSLVSRTPSGLFDHHSATCARSVLYQGEISSPHRRAEATGHLLRACEVGGVFKVKTISSNIGCAPPCKNSETVPCRATHFPAVCAVHSDARRLMPPD